MGFSRLEYPYTGGAQDFAVNFALGILEQEDVQVYVVGEVDGFGNQLFRAFTWVNDGLVRVTDPLPNPSTVVVERTVDKDQLEISLDGTGTVTRVTLVRAFRQLMMNIHELLDGRADSFTGALLDSILGIRDEAQTARAGAEAAETNAAASLTSFQRIYLGPFATPPTLDNEGNEILEGSTYWNTTDNTQYVRNGTGQWEAAPEGPQGDQGIQGNPGDQGIPGPAGQGVPAGGATGQVLKKTGTADYATDWQDDAGGGGLFKGENGTVGTSAGDIFRVNEQELNTDVTIAAGENAQATGPLTVADGVTLTVVAGATLVIT